MASNIAMQGGPFTPARYIGNGELQEQVANWRGYSTLASSNTVQLFTGSCGLTCMGEKDPSLEIKGKLEALLFVAKQAVSTKALALRLDLPESQAEELLRELAHDLEAPNRACACGMSRRNQA